MTSKIVPQFTSPFLFAYDSLEYDNLETIVGKSHRVYSGYCGIRLGGPGIAYKLVFKNINPWKMKHSRHSLANPTAKIGAAAIVGENAKAIGVFPNAGVVFIGDLLYKRLTLKDVGREGVKGLLRQDKNRLIWFIKPLGEPTQDVVKSLLGGVL